MALITKDNIKKVDKEMAKELIKLLMDTFDILN